MLLTIVITVVALFGYLLNYLLDKNKHRRAFRVTVIVAVVFALAAIWGKHFHQKAQSENESKATEKRHKEMIEQYDSLAAQVGELTQELEPFLQMARTSYPALRDDEALAKLAAEISKMQPKLVFLGQTEPRRDSLSNLFHTVYGFRSEPTTGLRDVKIKIRFDGRFVAINGGKRGDIVEGGGSMIIDPDSTGFYYTTRYLREGNDIQIEVISKSTLTILSISLWPYPDK